MSTQELGVVEENGVRRDGPRKGWSGSSLWAALSPTPYA